MDQFMTRLRNGDLVAMGFPTPLRPETVPVPIAAEHWRVLAPNFQNSTAKGAGAEYFGMQVYTRQDLEQRVTASPGAKKPEPDPERFRSRKPRGRPSCMPQIEAELRLRGTRGELLTPKIAEFEYLAEWAKIHCQDADPPSKAWIQKKLGKVYDELIGRKKTEKKA